MPWAISPTKWSAASVRATSSDSVAASAGGVLGSCSASVSLTISATSSPWTPSCGRAEPPALALAEALGLLEPAQSPG